jgi:DNA polymerase-3 subunit delta'
MSARGEVWDAVVGQDAAVAALQAAAVDPVHAYLFVGPPGCTKWEAARAFAALLLDPSGDPRSRDVRLALAGEHPDVREVRRTGPAISADQARDIVRLAALAPVETERKVFILDEFHLLTADAAARLLKTVEEPPASTVFIVVADDIPPELVTIASRCARIDFRPIPADVLEARLAAEGVGAEDAALAARDAAGSLDRARILATDPASAARHDAFARVPHRLDGTGASVCATVDELLGMIEGAAAPLADRHVQELAELEARLEHIGERGSGRKQLEERHKRELRRHRTDELIAGLTTIAGVYRDQLFAGGPADPADAARAVSAAHRAIEAMERNPNETLLLWALLLELPAAGDRTS